VSDVAWSIVSEIFADALELPVADRAAFVAERCADDPALRAAVERMLAARDEADPGFLKEVSRALLDDVAATGTVSLERIGPWRVVREIGRGGMGQVFLAERADGQFEQQVAIKLLKRGMDSDAILARFLRERQILAALDHPNIARFLDGGVAGDGRPYFVMEYVDGAPITAFADAQRLTVDARLALLRTVCLAVEYAHRNLVVHRDLKPSNILITSDGRPKLLDFGIAKLLSSPDDKADAATLTSAGVRLLTPDYAAPEQFLGGAITTATDVYGLGAVLFDLLAGRPPHDRTGAPRGRSGNDTDSVSLPDAPFEPASQAGAVTSPQDVALLRSTDPGRLRRRLAGDLETIVATALRTAPERRYASVGALHDDLRRHVERLPILARPDTLGYRASRFVQRHRVGVLAATIVAVLLVAFGVTTAFQARALATERDRARREATAAHEVSEFLVGVFEVADPMTARRGGDVRASDLLEHGATKIETDLAGQPAVQARLLGVIGRAFANLTQRDRAAPLLERAAELHRSTDGPESPAYVDALQWLARVKSGMGDHPRGEALLREAIAIQRRVAPNEPNLWELLVDLAFVIHAGGDNERGQKAVVEAMTVFNSRSADTLEMSRDGLLRMADLVRFSSESTYADSVFSRLVRFERAASGADGIPVAAALGSWAGAKARRGALSSADSMFAEALRIQLAHNPTSLGTGSVLQLMATLAMRRGDYVRADSQAGAAVRILRDRLGEDHRQLAIARSTHGEVLHRRGLYDEAITSYRAVATVFARDSNDARSILPPTQWRLGLSLRQRGRLQEAIAAFDSSERTFQARFPANYLLTANVRRDYGDALVDAGRPAEAEPMLRKAIDVLGARWGLQDARVDAARVSLGRALAALGRTAEARALLTEVQDRGATSRGAIGDSAQRRAREALQAIQR
jgi:serine/threonine-protein kinase